MRTRDACGRVSLALAAGCAWTLSACHATTGEARAADGKTTPVAAVPAAAPHPLSICRAGTLPRLNESTVSGGADALIAASKRGTVAIVWDGARAFVVADCRLDGTSVVIPGRGGKGVFRATNRVLFLIDEIPADCRRATHVVAALASDVAPSGASGKDASRLGAVLVPLPCPSVTDRLPAVGCIDKGARGAARQTRAAGLWAGQEARANSARELPALLEAWALAPDGVPGVLAVRQVSGGGMSQQARFIAAHHDIDVDVDPPAVRARKGKQKPEPPTLDYRAPSIPIFNEPPFRASFPEIVDPDLQFAVIPGGK
jgi:hypothetical protein